MTSTEKRDPKDTERPAKLLVINYYIFFFALTVLCYPLKLCLAPLQPGTLSKTDFIMH